MEPRVRELIQDVWLFQSLDAGARSQICDQFTLRPYQAGQFIFYEGDPSGQLYLILSGIVSVETYAPNGKVTQYAHLGAGDLLGEFAILDAGPRSASARVFMDAEIAALNQEHFLNLLDTHPEFVRALLFLLVKRLRSSNHQIESLMTRSLLQRTAELILHMFDSEGPHLKITQKQLSDRLFASREKVNAKLKFLENVGAIQRRRGKLDIISADILRKNMEMADEG